MKTEQKHTNDTRISVLEINNDHILNRLDRIERLIESFQNEMRSTLKDINNRIWTNFYWTLGAITGLGLLMAHGFKWF